MMEDKYKDENLNNLEAYCVQMPTQLCAIIGSKE